MIRKERARTSSLFLMELILAILFFSITSAVCVQFFVKSHILSQDSKALTLAVNECSAVAETCKTTKDLSDAEALLKEIYPSAEVTSQNGNSTSVVSISFDRQFHACPKTVADYEMKIRLSQEDTILYADMDVTDLKKNNASVYQLHTSHHIARRTAHETK